MVFFKLMLFFVVVAAASVNGRPTHCERHKGDSEFRCAKDDYRKDKIHVRNIANSPVSFKVSKYFSTCGRTGTKYVDTQYSLQTGDSADIDFEEAGPKACNELYIYDCKIAGQGRNCLDVVSPSPQ